MYSFEKSDSFFLFLRHIICFNNIFFFFFYVTFLRAKKVTKEGTKGGDFDFPSL